MEKHISHSLSHSGILIVSQTGGRSHIIWLGGTYLAEYIKEHFGPELESTSGTWHITIRYHSSQPDSE